MDGRGPGPYVGPSSPVPTSSSPAYDPSLYYPFFFISQTGTIVIFTVMFLPLSLQAGINPWMPDDHADRTMTWNVFYQNANYIVAYSATGGDLVDRG